MAQRNTPIVSTPVLMQELLLGINVWWKDGERECVVRDGKRECVMERWERWSLRRRDGGESQVVHTLWREEEMKTRHSWNSRVIKRVAR